MSLPEGTRRLFAHYEPASWGQQTAAFLLERLLEDGDGEDLRWLTTTFPEQRLASWVERRGSRRLSQRSRRFWEAILAVEAGPAAVDRGELWPL